MSRVWLILLLLVNVLFFAAMRWGALLTEEPEAPLAQAEFNAGKVRLQVSALPSPGEAVPVSATQAASAARAAEPVQPASHLSQELAAPPSPAICMAWGEFSGEDLARANSELSSLQLGDKLQRRTVEYDSGYWVYMPPQKNIEGVNRKIDQLRKLGVTEYFVVQEKGEWLHAISLGVFRTQQAAGNFLNELKTKGVRSAQLGERKSKLKFTLFELHDLDVATAERLKQIQQVFPDSELKPVGCN